VALAGNGRGRTFSGDQNARDREFDGAPGHGGSVARWLLTAQSGRWWCVPPS